MKLYTSIVFTMTVNIMP